MPRLLGGSQGNERFFMGEVPLYLAHMKLQTYLGLGGNAVKFDPKQFLGEIDPKQVLGRT